MAGPVSEVLSAQPLRAPALDDVSIVARIRSGDEAAFERLYLQYHEPLWRFAHTLVRSAAVAEDLVHDVFLALWRDHGSWSVTTSARLWLYGAVRNRAMNHLRHERVVSSVALHAPIAMGAPPPDAQAAVEARDLDERVDRALAGVSERRRIAMVLRWRHEFTPAEIASVLGTTPEAVRVLLARARQDLAALIRDDG